jgi:hypothetical protein
MVFVHPLPAAILAPVAAQFVPPIGLRRYRYSLQRALLSNLGAANLLAINGITLFMSVVLCGSHFPWFKSHCVVAALLAVLLCVLWIVLTPHPAKRLFYWRGVKLPTPPEA